MTYDDLLVLTQCVNELREVISDHTLASAPFKALDKLDEEITRIANHDCATSAERNATFVAIQESLERMRCGRTQA